MKYPAICFVLAVSVLADGNKPPARVAWTGPGVNTLGTPSLDGRWLSFVDSETGDLALRNLATGENRRLTRNAARQEFAYFSTISPDARQVAYAWFNDQKFYDLRVVATDGSAPRVLYRNEEAGFVQPSAWTPDGRHILTLFFRKDNISQIALVSASDGAVRVLKSLNWVYPKKMDISPDGRYVVYDAPPRDKAAERDIFLLALDGSREVRLAGHPADDVFPLWAPDGRRVLFTSTRGGTLDLWSVAVDEGKQQGAPALLARNLGRILPMGITRPGTYYYGLRAGGGEVVLASLDPPRLIQRFGDAWASVDFSADGESAAWLARRGSENYGQESRVIVIHSLVTGRQRELAPKLAILERLRWSPNGLSVLVSGSDSKSRGGLYRVDTQTGAVAPIAQDESAPVRGFDGAWSADGHSIYYARDGIRRYSLATGQDEQVYRAASSSTGQELAIAPDGRSLAFFESGALLVWPTGGGESRRLMEPAGDPPAGLAWTRDGRQLIFTRDGKLWRVSVEGGAVQALPLAANASGAVSVHPDGRRIAFTAGQAQNEVWALEIGRE